MQRRSHRPGVAVMAAALLAGLAGCTGSSDGDGAEDAKGDNPSITTPAAEPGKYSTLPEACGAPGKGTLRELLPGIEELPENERDKAYAGEAAITYDTDRRVGCSWTAESPQGTRHLSIDFERVVSYDTLLSDEDRAQQLYDRKAEAAGIPAPDAGADEGQGEDEGSGEPSASASGSSATSGAKESGEAGEATGSGDTKPDGKDKAGDAGSDGDTSGSPSARTSGDPGTAPRALGDPGDVAYIDDVLVTTDSGVHRDIELVFRTSNVLVTIAYDQWSTRGSELPDSEDLQTRAQRLAAVLSERFDD